MHASGMWLVGLWLVGQPNVVSPLTLVGVPCAGYVQCGIECAVSGRAAGARTSKHHAAGCGYS